MHKPPAAHEDAQLPAGECRYILLHPEVKGQRCACVGFALNATKPGSSCSCGHLACYHEAKRRGDALSEREEMDLLRNRMALLEEQLDRERSGSIIARLSNAEDLVERHKAEAEGEMKNVYRGIQGLWQNISSMQKHLRTYEDRIEMLEDGQEASQSDVRALRTRVIELDDASMRLEDRVDALGPAVGDEPVSPKDPTTTGNDGPSSGAAAVTAVTASAPGTYAEISQLDPAATLATDSVRIPGSELGDPRLQVLTTSTTSNDIAQAWTVHVSLLPTASQPFPFEKDTVAYKRCLSRGLHRMVAIPGPSSEQFNTAISNAFGDLLKGRIWMPLVAKICDAQQLQGLPMLRQLPDQLIRPPLYSYDFLRRNCATLDANGKIADLYIAMRFDVLRWANLRLAPHFLAGLEGCWAFDQLLDRDDMKVLQLDEVVAENEMRSSRPVTSSALMPSPWSPSATSSRLKRAPSELSRSSSFGSADGEAKRAQKIGRPFASTTSAVDCMSRRAEAVCDGPV